ncbi:MAG: hypothetical protein H8F28_20475 [Fibrella sp.]|nr:hypothetical protein [Armatimonadota bacterium]
MTPTAFVTECGRRGIRLSLSPPSGPGELPRVHYRAARGRLSPRVLETIKRHKAAIIAALEAESGVWHLPDGRKLYRHHDGWGYVPPGADPADHLANFPPGYHLRRE